MSPFETYAAEAAPMPVDRRADRRKKAPSKLDLKMEEKQRLTRAYKIQRRALRIEILQREPRLLDFMRYLRRVGPDDADDLLDGLRECEWLLGAAQDIRGFALSRIASRETKIKLALGEVPFDDPLPPATSVFFEAQKILRQGGPL